MGPPISRVNFHPSYYPVIFFGPLKKGGYPTYNDRSAPGALILFDPLLGCPRNLVKG